MRPRIARVVFAFCLISVLFPPRVVAQTPLDGGDPPKVLFLPGLSEQSPSDPGLAIASDGTQFVAYSAQLETLAPYTTQVLRSVDGGDTWELWHVFDDPVGDDDYDEPRIEIIGRGTGAEEIVVAYRVRGTTDEIQVAYADADATVPTWTVRTAIDYTGAVPPGVEDYDLAVGDDGQTTVVVGAVIEVASDDFEWRFASSLNSGLAFTTQQVLYSETYDPASTPAPAIAVAVGDFGGDDRAYVLVSTGADEGATEWADVLWTTATNYGVVGGFDPLITVASRSVTLQDIDLAAQIDGDDLVFAAEGDTLEFFVSENGGANWVPPVPIDTEGLPRQPRVRWDLDGFVLVVESDPGLGDSYFTEFRPDGALTGTWSGRTLLRTADAAVGAGSVASDPSRPGEVAITVSEGYLGTPKAVLYNGTWRDAPGYGQIEGDQPAIVFGEVNSAPAIGDLQGDGDREVVVTSRSDITGDSYVSVADGPPGPGVLPFREIDRTSAASAPALFDVDGDGDLEIFIGLADGAVLGLDHDLADLEGWPVPLPSSGDTWVSVGPVSGYAYGEVVVTHGNAVHVSNHAGLARTGWPWSPPSGVAVGRAALGDVDGDGTTEVVAAFTTGVAILNHDGTVQRVLQGPFVPSTGVTLADLDADGDLEIAGPMQDGLLLLIHHDGSTFDPAFPYDTGTGAPVSAVAVADLVTFGTPTLVFTAGSHLFALRTDGTPVSGYPLPLDGETGANFGESVIARVARPVADRPQLVVGASDARVHVHAADGSTPRDWPRDFLVGPVRAAALSDLDLDGRTEMVLPVGSQLWTLDMGVAPLASAARRWGQSGHDRSRSGCADCAPATPTSVESGTTSEIASVDFRGAWPNPAADRTTFSFTLPVAADVELSVYDLRGRRVRTVSVETRGAGTHSVVWDTRDDRGRGVATGTYVGRLSVGRDGGEIRTKLITVVR